LCCDADARRRNRLHKPGHRDNAPALATDRLSFPLAFVLLNFAGSQWEIKAGLRSVHPKITAGFERKSPRAIGPEGLHRMEVLGMADVPQVSHRKTEIARVLC
jgi:hypothetical protein